MSIEAFIPLRNDDIHTVEVKDWAQSQYPTIHFNMNICIYAELCCFNCPNKWKSEQYHMLKK
jgi:hypothetical protein